MFKLTTLGTHNLILAVRELSYKNSLASPLVETVTK